MTYRETMRQLAHHTQPDRAALDRVHGRLARHLEPTTALLQQLPVPRSGAGARVQARLAAGRPDRRPLGLALGLGLAGAAAATAFVLWPAPSPQPVTLALSAGVVPIGEHIELRVDGLGEAEGHADDAVVRWESGTLGATVTPARGAVLEVHTREARVQVIGTGFDVSRDALGTTVTVDHGAVQVDCVRSGTATGAPLGAGEQAVCLPVSAAGMLGRAQALDDRGGSPDEVLAALDEADALASDDDVPVRVEIRVERMAAHLALGAPEQAVIDAEEALALGASTRSDELHRAAATLWVLADRCDRALPHLESLQTPTATESAHLEHCQTR